MSYVLRHTQSKKVQKYIWGKATSCHLQNLAFFIIVITQVGNINICRQAAALYM